jgi:Flp pilus assembly CpaE family ATPase
MYCRSCGKQVRGSLARKQDYLCEDCADIVPRDDLMPLEPRPRRRKIDPYQQTLSENDRRSIIVAIVAVAAAVISGVIAMMLTKELALTFWEKSQIVILGINGDTAAGRKVMLGSFLGAAAGGAGFGFLAHALMSGSNNTSPRYPDDDWEE